MSRKEAAGPAILVGTLVRVARPVGGGPVNREGHTGRVLDIAGDRHGREALVDYGTPGGERWVPLRYLVPASTPLPPGATLADEPRRVCTCWRLRPDGTHGAGCDFAAEPVDFEHGGIAEHLDAIEERTALAHRRRPRFGPDRVSELAGVHIEGHVAAARAELVEKSA